MQLFLIIILKLIGTNLRKDQCLLQTITNKSSIIRQVVNVKEEYQDLWLDILSKVEIFQRNLTNTGLE